MTSFQQAHNGDGVLNIQIKKGYDIKLAGAPAQKTDELPVERIGFALDDFRYLKPKVLVKEGDSVKKGTPLFCDKKNPEIVFVSPVGGEVESIVRGERRVLQHVIVKKSHDQAESFESLGLEAIKGLDADGAKKALLDRGLWPCLQRRPFHKIAEIEDAPSSIFVTAMDSNPHGADPGYYLSDRGSDLQAGIELLLKICPTIHVCIDGDKGNNQVFQSLQNVQVHTFSGIHPKGNLSVHIDYIDPQMTQKKTIWSLKAQDLAVIGKTLTSGEYDHLRTFVYSGPGASSAQYYRTTHLNSLAGLPKKSDGEARMISGSVLNGKSLNENGFLGFYDHNVCVLREGKEREFLGWLKPGFKAHSLTRCFASNLVPQSEYEMTTSTHGDLRAIVDSEMYDKVQPLDIHTCFLYKSLLAGDIDEAERLGLWSVAPEDFALASYMDPSKNDFSHALTETLDILYKEEN